MRLRGHTLLLLLVGVNCLRVEQRDLELTITSHEHQRGLKKTKGSKSSKGSKGSKGSKRSKSASSSSYSHSPESTRTTSSESSSRTSSSSDESEDDKRSRARNPTREPTPVPTVDPANLPLATGNIFEYAEGENSNDSSNDHQSGSKADGLSTPPEELVKPRFVIATVSVAITRSLSPSTVQPEVAKVTTNVVRSFTPFVVYMLDGSRRRRRRQLQTTDLMYDPKRSSTELAHHETDVSWWKYQIAYEVTKEPEEQEESLSIDEMTEAAVVGAVRSGLFFQLLSPMTSDVHGVAEPGNELHTVPEGPSSPTASSVDDSSSAGNSKRNRSVWVGVGLFSAVVIAVIVFAFVVSNRRRRRALEDSWTITMGEQKERGEIVNAEWNSAYCGESGLPSEMMGAFSLTPQECVETFSWEQTTADGTAEVTAQGSSFAADTDGERSLTNSCDERKD